jgi:hypothetical protein
MFSRRARVALVSNGLARAMRRHAQVRTVAELTADADDLRRQFQAKLSAAPLGRTNVHLGLDLAVSKLLAQDTEAMKRILLFTDGLPSSMPLAEKSFRAAKAAGVIVQVSRCASGRIRCLCCDREN